MITPDLVALRRSLHQAAEIGLDLPATQRAVIGALADLPLSVHTGRKTSSVTAVLTGAHPGPTVLLRSDMDALPLTETTGLPFAAPAGVMHACGHDLHMAALVGAARLLAADREKLHGTVVLAFQPGEEGYGGARLMLDEGLLDVTPELPAAAYALHVIADLPHGVVFCRPGPIMAAYTVLEVDIVGRGAHGGRPHEGADPVPAAAECVLALHSYVGRRFDAFDPVVLTVGSLHAGTAPNVVAEHAVLSVGVRTFSETTTHRVIAELPRLIRGITDGHGLTGNVTVREVMGPTVNDPGAAAAVADVARELFGDNRFVELDRPRGGSEDFSEILREIPGAFCYLGAARPGALDPVGNHSPASYFDDSLLPDAARLMAALARHHLLPAAETGRPDRRTPDQYERQS